MNVAEIFGENVFNEQVMRDRLPKVAYESIRRTIEEGTHLEEGVANIVANVMKDWAIEKGATHFSHWFQPMTSITAEKHDSFITPAKDGKILLEFSGKNLVVGESDASSFPNGGIRATFEARGYTAWDPTSYAFVKDNTLYIPTAFCSYSGEVLDKKTPLLRSMEALNKQAVRILKLFGNENVNRVTATVGAEQEYFLIDEQAFFARKDLMMTGRTLFGAKAPKGQELDDHYFGTIKPRVLNFMRELDEEAWKLGILAKTEHNEVAPAQHEFAPIFTTTNLATDHNQLTMELMKKIAQKHNMACLLHEKPFESINGSGKHNNWSMSTNTGVNLLDPGSTAEENAQFMLFLVAVIKAVDEYQDLLRLSVASAGNDHRLGANEAPPAIVSMYLGDELTAIVDSLISGEKYNKKSKKSMKLGVDALPVLPKDTSDRNRTSPFAFTGNKFEFRMLGSSFSIAGPNIILNSIVADELEQFADVLEKATNFEEALNKLVVSTLKEHKRILFSGNNYSDEWRIEAEKRGLLNLKNTAEALPYFHQEKNVKMFERQHVFNEIEVKSRTEIMLENYCKIINIEVSTMIEMAKRDIYPSVNEYIYRLCKEIKAKKDVSSALKCYAQNELVEKLSENNEKMFDLTEKLENLRAEILKTEDLEVEAKKFADSVIPAMSKIRELADEMETLTDKEFWPMPTYSDILFSVK